MLTTRDTAVIDFLRDYKIASTSTFATMLFPSVSACQKRLKALYSNNKIKRMRNSLNSEYLYFLKMPKQVRHSLLVTEFYREFSKIYDVVNFRIEPKLGAIQPDAIFGYRANGKGYVGLLEVEISNKGFNFGKYNIFYRDDYKKYFPAEPVLYVVSDKIKPIDTSYKIEYIKTDLSNLRRSVTWRL